MVRFLVLFSYLGRNFSGLQVQTYSPVKTVVGVLQYAFTKLVHQIDYPGTKDQAVKFVTSSRTDRGVSALCNAGHVDIYSPKFEQVDVDEFAFNLNIILHSYEEDISILRMMRVPDDFHSRYNALSRSYVYRVCCLGNRNVPVPTALDVPLLERQTCMIIRQQLDMESVQKAAQLLTGRHDFRAFTTPTNRRLIEDDASNNNNDDESDIESVKEMEVKVQSGQGALDEYVDYLYGGRMKIWDFHFRAHSFLYRQVRKMVGAMVSVGLSHMTLDHLKQLLDPTCDFQIRNNNNNINNNYINNDNKNNNCNEDSYSSSSFEIRSTSQFNGKPSLSSLTSPQSSLPSSQSSSQQSSSHLPLRSSSHSPSSLVNHPKANDINNNNNNHNNDDNNNNKQMKINQPIEKDHSTFKLKVPSCALFLVRVQFPDYIYKER